MSEYFDEKEDRLYIPSVKEIIHKAGENFMATITLPQVEKPKKIFPKDRRPILQILDEILKGE